MKKLGVLFPVIAIRRLPYGNFGYRNGRNEQKEIR